MTELQKSGEADLHLRHNRFLLTLGRALHQAQLYEPAHMIMEELVQQLSPALSELLAESVEFTFQSHDHNPFVNGQRLRCDGPTFLRHQEMIGFLEARMISGVSFRGSPGTEALKSLLWILARADRQKPTVFDDVTRAVETKGMDVWAHVLPLVKLVDTTTPGDAAGGGPDSPRRAAKEQKASSAFALRTFMKSAHLLRQYIAHLDNPTRRRFLYLRLQRIIIDLIELCEAGGWRHLGLVNNKRDEGYLFFHSANVAILAILIGLQLRLKRPHLAELALAALLHDVGKARLPEALLSKQGELTADERKALDAQSEHSLRAILSVKQYNEAMLKRIMVICEHQKSSFKSDAHPYSRLIATACTFDALASTRPQRPAFAPDRAMKMLWTMAGKRLDRRIVTVFLQTFGLYPPGTLVELSDKSLAVVFQPAKDPKQWKSPIVRMVADPTGTKSPAAPLADLSIPDAGGLTRSVVASRDPVVLGIQVAGYLSTDLPA